MAAARPGAAAPSESGTIVVAVFDDAGYPISDAHVYIYGGDKKHLIDGQDITGSSSFELTPGRYRVYAAITKSENGAIEHYASHEATVRLASLDRASIILTLHRVREPIVYIPESALKKLKIDPALEKYLN